MTSVITSLSDFINDLLLAAEIKKSAAHRKETAEKRKKREAKTNKIIENIFICI